MLGLSGRYLTILVAGVAVFAALSGPVSAEDVTEQQILKALSPPKTRGLTLGPPAKAVPPQDAAFIDSLRNKQTGALSENERAQLDKVAADKPTIDLTMEFDLNSDVLKGAALKTAHELGKALASVDLKDQTFMIAGHTDAKGSDALNQKLSERRADSVKRFLVKTYKIPAANLIGVGYGKVHLKNVDEPDARENRRVQTVNMMQVKTAAR